MSAIARIGTSGWNYKHWRGWFYPPELPQKDWLAHDPQHFDAALGATGLLLFQ